ncbi:alkylglycerol monooxygenase-like isoform X2 [Salvelinus alpinus]|uniref:alkylglycerol monooxygenase-like isoform X2 n=1 Tax=Salvelinus alpinus TaxID=8036 RepID=UPI0039FCF489
MDTYHAAHWSDPCYSSSDEEEIRYRTTHQKRTEQRGNQEQRVLDSWTWEEILDGKGSWAQPGEYRRPKEELEAARAERRHYEELARELNFLWAAHQVHHSSEYYNLSTALRQSLTQQFSSWVFYLPMALAVPPSVFAVHIQFNLLYQFWIHTEVIRDMGPLEWVLNTPSHHRVHHGRNEYCIDKNYGGALIIWDRLFGTFAPEGDKVVYGLVHKINTYEILQIQFHYYKYLWRRFNRYKKIFNKLGVLWKGPSWKPGKPRLGDHAEVPEVTGEELPYNPSWPLALKVYVCIHGLMLLGVYQDLFESRLMLSQLTVLMMTGYILLSLTSIGFIIDQRPTASMLELLRCVLMVMLLRYGYMTAPAPLAVPIEAFVSISLLYWGLQTFSQLIAVKKKTT